MQKSRMIPLAKGLIGGKGEGIHGQLEVFLTNHDTIEIVFHRKPYGGASNVDFSISCDDLQDMINILSEAKEKSDNYWLSRAATTESKR